MEMKLREHQKKALARMSDKRGFALYHDTGTGKTFTTLKDYLYWYGKGEVNRALIICPISAMQSWVHHFEEYSPFSPVVIRGSKARRSALIAGDAVVKIINYDLIASHKEELRQAGFDYLVADESQRLISPKTKWTKAALMLSAIAKVRRVLTGTPIRKWEIDLFNQMRFIDPAILPYRSHFAFRKRFAIEQNMGGFSKIIGVRNVDEIRARCAPYCDYVSFDDVVDMPLWVDEQLYVPMVPEQARVYRELKRQLLTQVNGGLITAQNAAIELLKLSQVAGGTVKDADGCVHRLGTKKMDELKDIVDRTKGSIVVWCRFVEEIRWIQEVFNCPAIHGGVPASDRESILSDFAKGKTRMLVCQIQAVAEGVNELCNAHMEVRWSYDWSYVSWVQSRARLRRMGRKQKSCLSIQLVTENSTDTRVINSVLKKQDVALGTLEAIRELLTD